MWTIKEVVLVTSVSRKQHLTLRAVQQRTAVNMKVKAIQLQAQRGTWARGG